MTVLLHWSDPHFGTEDPAVAAALLRLAQRLQPDAYLLTGDITQRATAAQFAAASRFRQALPDAHWLVLPGNHDIPLFHLGLRWLAPYRRYCRFEAGPLDPVLRLPGVLALGVHTTRPWRHVRGDISSAQIAATSQHLLAASPRDWRLVLTHHPLAVLHPPDQAQRPRQHTQASRNWLAAGADVFLSGHIHQAGTLALKDDASGRTAWVASTGTALSHRLRAGAPHSVRVLRQQSCAGGPWPRQIERWDHAPMQGEFVRTEVLHLPPG